MKLGFNFFGKQIRHEILFTSQESQTRQKLQMARSPALKFVKDLYIFRRPAKIMRGLHKTVFYNINDGTVAYLNPFESGLQSLINGLEREKYMTCGTFSS